MSSPLPACPHSHSHSHSFSFHPGWNQLPVLGRLRRSRGVFLRGAAVPSGTEGGTPDEGAPYPRKSRVPKPHHALRIQGNGNIVFYRKVNPVSLRGLGCQKRTGMVSTFYQLCLSIVVFLHLLKFRGVLLPHETQSMSVLPGLYCTAVPCAYHRVLRLQARDRC